MPHRSSITVPQSVSGRAELGLPDFWWRDANQVEAVYPASTQPFLLNTVKTHRVKGRNNGGQRVKKGDLKSQNLLSLLEKRRQITPGH